MDPAPHVAASIPNPKEPARNECASGRSGDHGHPDPEDEHDPRERDRSKHPIANEERKPRQRPRCSSSSVRRPLPQRTERERCVTSKADTANETAFAAKTQEEPIAPTSSPPSAGPTVRRRGTGPSRRGRSPSPGALRRQRSGSSAPEADQNGDSTATAKNAATSSEPGRWRKAIARNIRRATEVRCDHHPAPVEAIPEHRA